MFGLEVVSFTKFLRALLLFFLGCDLRLAFDGATLEFKCFLLLVLHLLPVAEIEHVDHISDQVLLHFEVER